MKSREKLDRKFQRALNAGFSYSLDESNPVDVSKLVDKSYYIAKGKEDALIRLLRKLSLKAQSGRIGP